MIRHHGGVFEFQDSDLTNHYKKILLNSDIVLDQVDDFLLNKGLFSNVKHFLYNDSFGTSEHYKADLMTKHSVDEFSILTNDKTTLGCLLIKASLENLSRSHNNEMVDEPKEKKSNITYITDGTKSTHEKNTLSTGTNEKNSPRATTRENLETEIPVLVCDRNLIIICGPNGIDYELYSQFVF